MLGCNGRCGEPKFSCCCCTKKKSAQPQNKCEVVNDLKDWRFWDRRRVKKKPPECKKRRCLSIQFCAPKRVEFVKPAPYDDGLDGIFGTKKLPDIPLTASHCENLNKIYLDEDWKTQFISSDKKTKTTKKMCPFSKDWMQEHSKYYADIVSPPVIPLSSNNRKRTQRLESDV